MRQIIRRLLPRSMKSSITAVLAGLSIAVLMNRTYADGFATGIQILLSYYDKLILTLFGWVTPYIESAFKSFFFTSIELHPIWTHVSILAAIYFLRNVDRLFAHGRRAAATYQLFFAIPIIILSGIGAGAFYKKDHSWVSELAVPLFPLLGIFVMAVIQGLWFASVPNDRAFRTWPDFGGSWGHFVLTQTLYGFGLLSCGFGLSVLFTLLLDGLGISPSSVIVLFLLVICLALYWLWVGAGIAKSRAPPTQRSFSARCNDTLDTPAAQLSISMLHTVMVFLSIVAASAGQNLLGL